MLTYPQGGGTRRAAANARLERRRGAPEPLNSATTTDFPVRKLPSNASLLTPYFSQPMALCIATDTTRVGPGTAECLGW